MHIRRNSSLNVYNSIFVGWPYGLYLQNANVGAVVKNVIFAGMWENFKDETSQNYFQTADLSNLTYASSNDIIAKDGDYTSIVADKIDGADFSDTTLSSRRYLIRELLMARMTGPLTGPTSIRITLNINLA